MWHPQHHFQQVQKNIKLMTNLTKSLSLSTRSRPSTSDNCSGASLTIVDGLNIPQRKEKQHYGGNWTSSHLAITGGRRQTRAARIQEHWRNVDTSAIRISLICKGWVQSQLTIFCTLHKDYTLGFQGSLGRHTPFQDTPSRPSWGH